MGTIFFQKSLTSSWSTCYFYCYVYDYVNYYVYLPFIFIPQVPGTKLVTQTIKDRKLFSHLQLSKCEADSGTSTLTHSIPLYSTVEVVEHWPETVLP